MIDRHTGHVLNADLEHYKIARSRETPAIEVILLENYQGTSATDAYGIAEPSNIATAPAIANAVYNAIGVRVRQLPMTPATVLAALGRDSGEGAPRMNRFEWVGRARSRRGGRRGQRHRRRRDAHPERPAAVPEPSS